MKKEKQNFARRLKSIALFALGLVAIMIAATTFDAVAANVAFAELQGIDYTPLSVLPDWLTIGGLTGITSASLPLLVVKAMKKKEEDEEKTDPKDFKDYLKEIGVSEEEYNKMDEEDQAEIDEAYGKANKAYLTFLITKYGKDANESQKTQLKTIETKIESFELDSKRMLKSLQEQGKVLAELVDKIKKGGVEDKRNPIAKAFEDNKELLIKAADQKEKVSFTIKTPVTVGINNTIGAEGSASHWLLTAYTGIVSTIRKRILKYLENVSVGTLSPNKPYAMWVEELDEQGAPIFLGEGAGKPQASVRYEEREKKAAKVAVFGKVTEEMLRYLPQLVTYFQNNLMKRLEIKMEDELYNGQGGANQLAGLVGYATAFNGGGLLTPAPSYADVFRALALQVEKAFGQANAVFVRPEILAQMDVEKADDSGVYLMPPFRAANGNEVAGMRLISSTGIPNGVDFVGGDLTVVNVAFTDAIRVEVDRDGTDFTDNKRTMLVEAELVQFVSANDTQVLIKGTMDTAIAAITEC
jgi:hypothetical protein